MIIIFLLLFFIKTLTLFSVPICFIHLNINPLSKYGIFFPFVAILFAYNLYIFSLRLPGLYFINGYSFVACINLNNTSNGKIYSCVGDCIISINDTPILLYGSISSFSYISLNMVIHSLYLVKDSPNLCAVFSINSSRLLSKRSELNMESSFKYGKYILTIVSSSSAFSFENSNTSDAQHIYIILLCTVFIKRPLFEVVIKLSAFISKNGSS